MEEQKVSKVSLDFYCKCCDYKCSKKQNYLKHLSTQKHKNIEMIANRVEIVEKPIKELFNCGCGKQYKHKYGLVRHKQTCDYKEPIPEDINIYKDLLIDANKKKAQLEDLLMHANKKNKSLEETVRDYEKFDRKQDDKICELRRKQLDLEYEIIKLKR
tara:strand:- start:650 stop:1123 length:474 start_codon:yes stop_codon:yes gene_type:complete